MVGTFGGVYSHISIGHELLSSLLRGLGRCIRIPDDIIIILLFLLRLLLLLFHLLLLVLLRVFSVLALLLSGNDEKICGRWSTHLVPPVLPDHASLPTDGGWLMMCFLNLSFVMGRGLQEPQALHEPVGTFFSMVITSSGSPQVGQSKTSLMNWTVHFERSTLR